MIMARIITTLLNSLSFQALQTSFLFKTRLVALGRSVGDGGLISAGIPLEGAVALKSGARSGTIDIGHV